MLLDTSIINLFEKTLSWDLFIQGFYTLNVLVFGFLFISYLINYQNSDNEISLFDFITESFKNRLNKIFGVNGKPELGDESLNVVDKIIKLSQFISISSIYIVVSFILGVAINRVSDRFMDASDKVHLGFKKNWITKIENHCDSNLSGTDKFLKLKSFDKIYGDSIIDLPFLEEYIRIHGNVFHRKVDSSLRDHIVLQNYYYGKHKILENSNWKEYLIYSQNLVNLTQTFCFSSYLLIIFSLIGLFFTFFTFVKKSLKKKRRLIELAPISIYLIGFLIFFILAPSNECSEYSLGYFIISSIVISFALVFRCVKGYLLRTSLTIFLFSVILYHVTAIAWIESEKEVNSKTYGIIKYLDTSSNGNERKVLDDFYR